MMVFQYRRAMRKALAQKYAIRHHNKEKNEERKTTLGPTYKKDVTHDVFVTIDSSQIDWTPVFICQF